MNYYRTTWLAAAATIGFFVTAGAVNAQTMAKELTGKIVALNGKLTQPSNASALAQAKYIAFYFGAGWCGPCHKFTPDLVSFYNDMKPKHPDFEIVFVSHDTSAPDMDSYMAEMKMPWPAMRYDAIKWSAVSKFCGPGIPCLVVVDQNGRVISDSYEGAKYVGPHKVLHDLSNLLEHGDNTVAMSKPASAASPVPAKTGTPPSPSGTNWDQMFKKKP